MRIGILFQGEFPPAERIEKFAKSLSAAGHQLFLLCNNYGHTSEHEQQVGAVHVVRLRPTFSSRKLNRIFKLPAFCNPLWVWQIFSLVRRCHIDVLQPIDIPLLPAAIWAGRWFRIPVVMDMWENYPEALRGWGERNWKIRLLKNHRLARWVELWGVRRVDRVITVVEEQQERLIHDGVRPDRVAVVTNAFDQELFCRTPVRRNLPLDPSPDSYKLIYVGGLACERGLDDIILAAAIARKQVPGLRVYIAGSGKRPDVQHLEELIASSGVSEIVHLLGWIPFEEIHSYILASDLCMVPHVNNDFINTTIPNKLFQYMALSKPVLVSNARPLARIVGESDCGYIFESGNPADAAARIVEAYRERHDARIGERGRLAVERQYTWEHAARNLLAVFAGL